MPKYENDHPTIKYIGLRRILVDEIRKLVKDYVNRTGDKDIESFEIAHKDGSYNLDEK